MPPSSSSGWAVNIIRLALVLSFFKLCQRALAPRFAEISWASVEGLIVVAYGTCPYAATAIRKTQSDLYMRGRCNQKYSFNANCISRGSVVVLNTLPNDPSDVGL